MLYATVVRWFEQRNFGFIQPDTEPKELFVYLTDTANQQPLPRNARVTYEIGHFGGRAKAIKVAVVEVR
jgi:cold shock CspA family protein